MVAVVPEIDRGITNEPLFAELDAESSGTQELGRGSVRQRFHPSTKKTRDVATTNYKGQFDLATYLQ